MVRRLLCYLSFLAIAASSIVSLAQSAAPAVPSTDPRHFDAYYLGDRVSLGPDWLFSPDDNPAYAAADYDDSAWKTISATKQLIDYGIRNIPYAWYRMHVYVNPRWTNLAIEIQNVEGDYELYVNGVRIAAHGKMSGVVESGQDQMSFHSIPNSMIAPNGDLVVAIRFAVNKVNQPHGESTSTPLEYDSVFIATRESAARDTGFETSRRIVVPLIESLLCFLVGIVALALYLAMRNQAEYLAIAIALLANSFQVAVPWIWDGFHGYDVFIDFLNYLAIGIGTVAMIEFVRLIVHMRRSRWLLALEIASLLGYSGVTLFELGLLSFKASFASYFVPALITAALLPVLLIRAAMRGNRDARVFLPAALFISLANYWNFLSQVSGRWHWTLKIPAMPYFEFGGYGLDLWAMWSIVYCVTMLLFLVLRTVGIARERARAAGELEAARTVQHVMIPEEIPSVPGFEIQSVYKPASQVGGDFFQILPVKNGGVLVVIGDVSGKGMPAAMTVSLLVGTVRTLAGYTEKPGEILDAMNQQMLARSGGGFTTCLVARADTNGTLTVANAGHIPPYLDGKELPLENGLPLGLAADTIYPEGTFLLAPGQQLTLLTDGVVESRDHAGALLGFERSAALSVQPAEAIACAAQEFGQDDDITVLTLSYAGAPVSA
jgi:phosphoserine phosphatase RsbU/P